MVIHNFFSDVLLSMLQLFETYIFENKEYFFLNIAGSDAPRNFFRSVQFNIGNRNWQLDTYKDAAQLEFPAGIFSFVSDETAFGKTNHIVGHHRIWDVNEILCTHNKNTNVDIMLREEQAMLYLTAQVNCESIAHANEVVHQIKRFLPTSKYVQLAPFSSFMQIPNFFFDKDNNNPEKHDIENLYLKYEPTTGEKNFFFKANYKPLIKLNSCNAEISDNSARSYIVMCDFNYLIQLPMWLFDTFSDPHILRINLNITSPDSLPCIIVDNNFLSVDNEPFKIMDFYYIAESRYLIELNSYNNYHDGKIFLPRPNSEEFIIQIAKLYQKESTVVNWAGAFGGLPEELREENKRYNIKGKECHSKFLEHGKYELIYNKETGNEELVLFSDGNPDLTPDLASPVVITILRPIKENEMPVKKCCNKKKMKIYTPRTQETWRKIYK